MRRDEHYYIITYDIADPRRWRKIYKILRGYGEWVQLSVFQLRMTEKRRQELISRLDEIIHHDDDHILCMDMGVAGKQKPRIMSMGKIFIPLTRDPLVV